MVRILAILMVCVLPGFILGLSSAFAASDVLVITETYTVDSEGLKDNRGNPVELAKHKEVHLDGANAAIIAAGESPVFIGHPQRTTVKAVGRVKGGKLLLWDHATNGRIENIIFDGNKRPYDAARGIWIDGGSGTTIENCTIQNVAHSGLTVLGDHAGLVVRNCTFKDISWPEMVICAVQGVQDEFKISDSTEQAQQGWLRRPSNALMEKWLGGRWTDEDVERHGKRGYDKNLYPMDVGYLHGIYLTGRTRNSLIENCTFENINWGFGLNITGESSNVKIVKCRFEGMGKGCMYIGGSDHVLVSEFEALKCATLLHLYRHPGKGSIVFQNGKASQISHYAFYVLDHYGRANLSVVNNKIDGCGKAFVGSTGGSGFLVRGNRITNLKGDRVWEHLRNTRDESQGAIGDVEFVDNAVSFKKAGAKFFGTRFPAQIDPAVGLGGDVRIVGNRFQNIDKSAWKYSELPGTEPVVGNNTESPRNSTLIHRY
ncbi:MAG: right-handed parallel beta-helix repeat-containing protein [Candidatus Nealsonbacteria bacterium]|nr:right-handed parallel beta-helix repeat-containing protein [Candidatus Nealsonbacteria bacterium]